jgi:hypothetical protein
MHVTLTKLQPVSSGQGAGGGGGKHSSRQMDAASQAALLAAVMGGQAGRVDDWSGGERLHMTVATHVFHMDNGQQGQGAGCSTAGRQAGAASKPGGLAGSSDGGSGAAGVLLMIGR